MNRLSLTHSDEIRVEIHRFESVHPCIYAVYDMLEHIDNPEIAQQIRDNVVCIEDSFVNSQEWTLSRSVPDLKLGVVGSVDSGKSSLVHRYLTGSYMQEESPEGGRFKKEVVIEGQSQLLLIRDEGGPPEAQFSLWVDAVIFVFSLESEQSFQTVYNYYAKMANYRNTADIPLILVGTQDNISADNPRVIDDSRARKLAHDLKRCTYYETCASYGLNVEKVFVDACHKILYQRLQSHRTPVPPPAGSCPSTPNPPRLQPQNQPGDNFATHCHAHNHHRNASCNREESGGRTSASPVFAIPPTPISTISPTASTHSVSSQGSYNQQKFTRDGVDFRTPSTSSSVAKLLVTNENSGETIPGGITPTSTPTTQRKNRRISNIFNRPSKDEPEKQRQMNNVENVGSGRAIPIKQGHLMKRSSKSVAKEWKKKFVCLFMDGRLCYYSNLKDYMENNHGKETFVGLATVKVPGQQRPPHRALTQPITCPPLNREASLASLQHNRVVTPSREIGNENVTLTVFEPLEDDNAIPTANNTKQKKSKHIRKGSGTKHDLEDCENNCEFVLVSSDQKQWNFEANSVGERDEWVHAIHNQIAKSLQDQLSNKKQGGHVDRAQVNELRDIGGNNLCVDCQAPAPDWASLNLGALMCIECSGIHRNLGSHISKVRSLQLDEWPLEYISVMQALGNEFVNSIWQFREVGREKPKPESSRELKELWIRAKYEFCQMLAPLQDTSNSLRHQLVDSVITKDIRKLCLVLAHCQKMGVLEEQVQGYNADPLTTDDDGHNCVWHAQQSGNGQCIHIIRQASQQTNSTPPTQDLRPQSYAGPGRNGVNGHARVNNINNMLQQMPASAL